MNYPLCPFYESEERGVLNCENRRFRFDYIKDKEMWLSSHCCSWNFKVCKFYNDQIKKYD